MKLTGENRSTRRKTCPSATLSTTNPTWTDPGSNPDLRGERPATNRLSHGTAISSVHTCFLFSLGLCLIACLLELLLICIISSLPLCNLLPNFFFFFCIRIGCSFFIKFYFFHANIPTRIFLLAFLCDNSFLTFSDLGSSSYTLGEGHWLWVCEQKVLITIFGPRKEKITGGWRKLHNLGLHALCYSPAFVRVIK
jgi:hypothetical protein